MRPSSSSRVPLPLAKLLEADRAVTKTFYQAATQICPEINQSYRVYLKALEISCHGVPWISMSLIFIYLFASAELREIQVNLLLGLLYDIIIVGLVKAVTRRNRPTSERKNDMFLTIGVDKFSFPSGHATRAVFVTLFFTRWAYPDLWLPFQLLMFVWAGAVCVSRVLLLRHHILDVAGGVLIGYAEFLLVGIFWIGPYGSSVIGNWISSISDDE